MVTKKDEEAPVVEDEESSKAPGSKDELVPDQDMFFNANEEILLAFNVLLFVCLMAVLVFFPPPTRLQPQIPTCNNLTCYDLRSELYSSMNLAIDPCDDFYEYVCGLWPKSHPEFDNQFHLLEAKVYCSLTKRLAEERLPPSKYKHQTMRQKAALSFLSCIKVYEKGLDATAALMNKLKLHSHFKGVPTAEDVLKLLIVAAMNWNVPVLFEILIAPEHRAENRRIIVVNYSPAVIYWMRHKKEYLSPVSIAECIRAFADIMETGGWSKPMLATALVKMDVEVTTKFSAFALFPAGKPSYVQLKDLRSPSVQAGVWLRAFNAHLSNDIKLKEDDEIYTTNPHIFDLVNELLVQNDLSLVHYYIVFQILQQLAPFTSRKLVESMFSKPSNKSVLTRYVTEKCARAASSLTSFALASLVFRDALTDQGIEKARLLYDLLKNKTRESLSRLTGSEVSAAEDRLSALHAIVAWPDEFNKPAAVDEFYSYLADFKGHYIEIYLNSIENLRNKQKAQTKVVPGSPDINGVEDNVAPVFRATSRYSNWYRSIFVPPAALLDPFFVPESWSFTVGSLGIANQLWHAALGDIDVGASSFVGSVEHPKHSCLMSLYEAAGGKRETTHSAAAEDLADVLGLQTSYAVHKDLNSLTELAGFSAEQLFFIGSCFKWCSKNGAGDHLLGETLPRLRCNVPLMLTAGFGEVFSCRNGSGMSRFVSGTCYSNQTETL